MSVLTKELYITLNIYQIQFLEVFFKIVADFKMGGGGHWEVISAHYLLPIHIQSRLKVKIYQAVIGSNMDHYHFSNLWFVRRILDRRSIC